MRMERRAQFCTSRQESVLFVETGLWREIRLEPGIGKSPGQGQCLSPVRGQVEGSFLPAAQLCRTHVLGLCTQGSMIFISFNWWFGADLEYYLVLHKLCLEKRLDEVNMTGISPTALHQESWKKSCLRWECCKFFSMSPGRKMFTSPLLGHCLPRGTTEVLQ